MGETVVHANPLATVTRNCLIVRDEMRRTQSVINIGSIRQIQRVNTTNDPLLVIAAGLFTIAAACYSSHQGTQVSAGIALIGAFFIFAYFSTRRAAIQCVMDDQTIESRRGSYREATSILRAVKRVTESNSFR